MHHDFCFSFLFFVLPCHLLPHRDVPKAKEMLRSLSAAPGGALELAAADITQPRTLLPGMFEGVRALICCTGERAVQAAG